MASDKVIQVSDGDFGAKALQSEFLFFWIFGRHGVDPAKRLVRLSMSWPGSLKARSRSER